MADIGRIAVIGAASYYGGPIAGAVAGAAFSALFPPEQAGIEGPKPRNTRITTGSYGQPVPIVLGTDVVDGQVFDGAEERRIVKNEESAGKGGGKGPTVTSYEVRSTFALLLAEVPAKGYEYKLRRLWWNGRVVYDRRPAIDKEAPDRETEDLGYFGAGGVLSTGEGVAVPDLGRDDATTGGLTWGYLGGEVRPSAGLGTSLPADSYEVSAGTVALDDDATNYVYFDVSAQQVDVNTTGFTADDIPLAVITTLAGSIASVVDRRVFVNTREFLQRAAVSDVIAGRFEYYSGAVDQEPDPTLEGVHGSGNVSAYRGFAYLVFDDLDLTEQGGTEGNWEAELTLSGQDDDEPVEFVRGLQLFEWLESDTDPRDPRNEHVYRWRPRQQGLNPPEVTSLAEASESFPQDTVVGWSYDSVEDTHESGWPGERVQLHLHLNFPKSQADVQLGDQWARDYLRGVESGTVAYSTITRFTSGPEPGFMVMVAGTDAADAAAKLPDGFDWESGSPEIDHIEYVPGEITVRSYVSRDEYVRVERVPAYPPSGSCGNDPDYIQVPEAPEWCVNRKTGDYRPNLAWATEEGQTGTTFAAVSAYDTAGSPLEVTQYPRGPVVRQASQAYDETFHVDDLQEAQVATFDFGAVEAQPILLADALQLICGRVGVTAIDVSALTRRLWGLTLRGGTARDYVERMRPWGLYDHPESEGKIKFLPRGRDPVMTLDADDLGAAEGNAGERLETDRDEDYELPRVVRITYPSLNAAYEPGVQDSNRQVTDSEQIVDVQCPVVMTDEFAAQLVEIAENQYWRSRSQRRSSLPRRYEQLDASDVVTLTLGSASYRVLVTEKRYSGAVSFRFQDDEAAEYASEAVAGDVSGPGAIRPIAGPTIIVPLELPPLQDSHNDISVYVAAYGVSTGWKGALIQVSGDGGRNYGDRATLTSASTIGELVTSPGTCDPNVIDRGNTIDISLLQGELNACSESDMLNGDQNVAAVGAHGRWLIVSFRDVEELANGDYRISYLVQGRLGTEHLIGTVRRGDQFVLLDSSLGRIVFANTAAGNSYRIRAASIGGAVPADDQGLVVEGLSLKPFSPVHIHAQRDDDDNAVITWVRRTRLGGGWQADPLYEDYERFELDFLRVADDDRVLRTETVAVTGSDALRPITFEYTAAMQEADYGDVPGEFRVRIYQMSAVVGRGIVGEETL